MLNAPRETPPPTAVFPAMGNSWFLVWKTAGLRGLALGSLYVAVALPFALAVLKAALAPDTRLADLFSLGALAAFFVAPYTRHYDFPVLLIPALVCVGGRLSEKAGALLLAALGALPYVQFLLFAQLRPVDPASPRPLPEYTLFWVPVLLTILWVATARFRSVPTGFSRGVAQP
jgi:hypothetical protein